MSPLRRHAKEYPGHCSFDRHRDLPKKLASGKGISTKFWKRCPSFIHNRFHFLPLKFGYGFVSLIIKTFQITTNADLIIFLDIFLNYKPKACQPQTSHVFIVNGRPRTDQEKQFIAMAINSLGTASGNTWYLEKYLKKIRTNYSIVGKRNVHDVHYQFLTNTEQPLVFLQYSGKEFYSKSLVCWQSLYFNSNVLGLQKLCCKH